METKNIQIPSGWEVDFEKSSKDNIVLKEVEKSKYPTKLSDLGGASQYPMYVICSSQKLADEVAAFILILAFRDAVWEIDEWEPDWTDNSNKYCLCIYVNEIVHRVCKEIKSTLAFKTQETRDWFLETHCDLIEKCKNLI